MFLDNFATSIKLRLLSAQSRDIIDIYQDINVSDLKMGENKIPITNPQIIRLLQNSTRVFNVSITIAYAGGILHLMSFIIVGLSFIVVKI